MIFHIKTFLQVIAIITVCTKVPKQTANRTMISETKHIINHNQINLAMIRLHFSHYLPADQHYSIPIQRNGYWT